MRNLAGIALVLGFACNGSDTDTDVGTDTDTDVGTDTDTGVAGTAAFYGIDVNTTLHALDEDFTSIQTWNTGIPTSAFAPRTLAEGGGTWLAIVAGSPGNTVWTASAPGTFTELSVSATDWTAQGLDAALYVGGAWYLAGDLGFLRSTNLSSFALVYTTGCGSCSENLVHLDLGGGRFYATRKGSFGGQLLTSTDGVSWSDVALPSGWSGATSGQVNAVLSGSTVVLVNHDGEVATSTDGTTFAEVTSLATGLWTSVAVDGTGRIVAVGNDINNSDAPVAAVSTDGGTTFTAATTLGTWGRGVSVYYDPIAQRFLARETNNVATSADGLSWAQITSVTAVGGITLAP